MYKIIDRNRNMYKLSILALVLYVLLAIVTTIFPRLFYDLYISAWFNLTISFMTMVVIWFGYVAVYVLWTTGTERLERKRPTWQFVLLMTTMILPRIIYNIIYLMTNIEFEDFRFLKVIEAFKQFDTMSLTGRIIQYLLLSVILAILIILFVKCERKAKKVMIIPIISSIFTIGFEILRSFVYSIDDLVLLTKWVVIMSSINSILAIVFGILFLAFTIIYTKQKYYEVKLPEPDIGTAQ